MKNRVRSAGKPLPKFLTLTRSAISLPSEWLFIGKISERNFSCNQGQMHLELHVSPHLPFQCQFWWRPCSPFCPLPLSLISRIRRVEYMCALKCRQEKPAPMAQWPSEFFWQTFRTSTLLSYLGLSHVKTSEKERLDDVPETHLCDV